MEARGTKLKKTIIAITTIVETIKIMVGRPKQLLSHPKSSEDHGTPIEPAYLFALASRMVHAKDLAQTVCRTNALNAWITRMVSMYQLVAASR